MANVTVRCPMCGRVKVNRRMAEKKTFSCCGVRHNVLTNEVLPDLTTSQFAMAGVARCRL